MCTAIVAIDPASPLPVLLVGVRDEFLDRAWLPPAHHWQDRPELIGGRDLQAGGTWLAVDPRLPRASCILNAPGRPAAEATRLSRGELPLRVAADGKPGDAELERYDPFHLIGAEPGESRLWSWDGVTMTERSLEPGLHLVVNSGMVAADAFGDMAERLAYFQPRFEAAPRPTPLPGSASVAAAWGSWTPLLEGDGLAADDPRALILRREHDDRIWGTSSISLVALGAGTVRYDFSGRPGDPTAWISVEAT